MCSLFTHHALTLVLKMCVSKKESRETKCLFLKSHSTFIRTIPLHIKIQRKARDCCPNPRSYLLLGCLSRPTFALTVRYATENEGRGALKPILEESARRNKKPREFEVRFFDAESGMIKKTCQSLSSRWFSIILYTRYHIYIYIYALYKVPLRGVAD